MSIKSKGNITTSNISCNDIIQTIVRCAKMYVCLYTCPKEARYLLKFPADIYLGLELGKMLSGLLGIGDISGFKQKFLLLGVIRILCNFSGPPKFLSTIIITTSSKTISDKVMYFLDLNFQGVSFSRVVKFCLRRAPSYRDHTEVLKRNRYDCHAQSVK